MFAELAKRKSKTKNKINDLLVKEFTPLNKRGQHILLDSVTFGSTNALVNSGISPRHIHIPQISCEEFLKMAKKKQTSILYRCSANKLLRHFLCKNQPFQSVYLDYCCSANGNKDVKPVEDLKLAMKLLDNNGVLAWTFSSRSTQKQDRKFQFIDEVRRNLDTFAKSSNYIIRHLFNFPYNSTQTHSSSGKTAWNKTGQTMVVTAVRIEKPDTVKSVPLLRYKLKRQIRK